MIKPQPTRQRSEKSSEKIYVQTSRCILHKLYLRVFSWLPNDIVPQAAFSSKYFWKATF